MLKLLIVYDKMFIGKSEQFDLPNFCTYFPNIFT